jgi:anti-sigma-K factor RskA
MELENDLSRVLRRESPPAGFAERVMARIEREEAHARHRRPAWWRAAAASVALTAVLGGWAAHSYVQYRQTLRAKEQVLLALRIAGSKVRYAQQQVQGIGN